MCFGSSEKDSGENLAPRPANGASSAMAHDSKASYPPQQQQQQQQQYAPPTGPPPSQSPQPYYAPPQGAPPSHSQPQGQYAPPTGPPPPQVSHQQTQYAPPPGPPPADAQRQDQYAPPPGPPPADAQRQDQYAPPPGAPPSHAQHQDQYAPPPGAPPSHAQHHQDQYAPPPGPPPGQDYAPPAGPPPKDPKPQHDWEIAVPDTSLFPPPPAFFSGWDRSPANNATEEEAERGAQWCQQYPLTPPITLDPPALAALQTHNIRLMQPWGFTGELHQRAAGQWECRTPRTAPDSCLISYPPLYAVTLHSPLASGRKHTVYYEVHVRNDSRRDETSLALGFTALPYPNFRLPGWHRGSMAIHGDDGHRYVNDTWGGQSFTAPFKRGDTYGVGMTFEPVEGRIITTCFFTRNGVLDGEWNLHEEQDSDVILPVTGLEGYHDLGCAIGTFNHVAFDVIFDPNVWKYRPS